MTLPKNYQAQQDALKEKVILISGGGSGIGKSAALIFAEHGADLILLGKNATHLESTYQEFLDKNLKAPLLHVMDLEKSKENDFKEINNVIEKEFGKLDGLLNNAMIFAGPKLNPLALNKFTFGAGYELGIPTHFTLLTEFGL